MELALTDKHKRKGMLYVEGTQLTFDMSFGIQ
jgi:hypothetical protein